jgi:outer membrane protein assembly factor BamB
MRRNSIKLPARPRIGLVTSALAAAAVLLVSLIVPPMVAALSSENDLALAWNQWRGPHRDGRVEGAAWPGDLRGLEPMWRVEVGKGYSGPIVTADRVFVVDTADERMARVRALRRDTGDEIWRREWPAKGDVPFFAASHGTWERSTPAYDGEVLYMGDMKEVLHALDGDTGEELWAVDFPQRYKLDTPAFGFASSPLLVGGYLYVQAANGLVKLDKRTGESIWRTAVAPNSIMSGGAFSSPILARLNGVEQIVVFTRSLLNGVDPESGRVLWYQEVPNFRGMNIVTPTVTHDGVFVSQYRNGSFFFRTHLEPRLDEDSDDLGRFVVETAWTNKGSGYMSSPVVIGDHVYQHLGNGRLSSIDLRTGVENWRTTPLGEYWSMVFQGDRILALDSEGTLRLVRANAERFELIDEREVAQSSTWGHIAVSGDHLFVREMEAVSTFRWSPASR